MDFGDYPLDIDPPRLREIAEVIREFAPHVLITHTDTDPFNPDHAVAHAAVARARSLAAGVGVPSAFATIAPPVLMFFEPHQPETCNFRPNTFVDITSVYDKKRAAMAHMKAQPHLMKYYEERAGQRGYNARRSGEPKCPNGRGIHARHPRRGGSPLTDVSRPTSGPRNRRMTHGEGTVRPGYRRPEWR